ncbi:SDR family oxidoreductase [Glaciimonas sp. PCH181]|uniref:SDR family oxidoreductase n=1 Tax=Glaciimonas sp. PCH181 TaxID=2133943 RepID=UPI000D3BFB5E|nr:SDR family oxidoreductase [Glaciimonas sp. PCH181]PUA19288.1 oxidoreductase [Glaciimonas sp. PCH181]
MHQPVVLITGASRGIGAATALLAGARGYAVCVNYVNNKAAADAVVDAIIIGGGKAIAVAADVAVESDVISLFETVDAKLGPLTALVNNAGILEKQMQLAQMDVARLQRIFTTNIIGSFICAREAVKRMSTNSGGSGGAIVNVSSVAARIGGAGEYVDYAASKGAIDTMTIGLAKEVIDQGIRVNAVRPGVIYTDIHASGGEAGRVVKDSIPMRRGGRADEVAQAILWLLSDQASYSTGTFIDVAGGR